MYFLNIFISVKITPIKEMPVYGLIFSSLISLIITRLSLTIITMNTIATVVVDYQNGFANKKTNELYVHGGEDIAPVINSIMQRTKDAG